MKHGIFVYKESLSGKLLTLILLVFFLLISLLSQIFLFSHGMLWPLNVSLLIFNAVLVYGITSDILWLINPKGIVLNDSGIEFPYLNFGIRGSSLVAWEDVLEVRELRRVNIDDYDTPGVGVYLAQEINPTIKGDGARHGINVPPNEGHKASRSFTLDSKSAALLRDKYYDGEVEVKPPTIFIYGSILRGNENGLFIEIAKRLKDRA